MERYICIHGHFYQPPRENPWLETIEPQDSAAPYHDWNARVAHECYAPNAASRILDPDGYIAHITNNYARISFNFGPTLLAWLERHEPDTYRAILEADAESRRRFSGHGSAMAQCYNHMIMPLANLRDKVTQVRWGIADFRHRFGRAPEGMWLPETAVDLETLEVLAEHGILFTVLSPFQAARVREIGRGEWRDVGGGHVDPSTAYALKLPSGRQIALFFYDGPIARAVAFEGLLNRGDYFAGRLAGSFSPARRWPQLAHIATDGESYGHHHRHGDMALAYALRHIEQHGLAKLTNYGEFLAKHPPLHEVQIVEDTAWSCFHGLERWRGNCGCGGRHGTSQAWRTPLRRALDWLRDELAPCFEQEAARLLRDPWVARDDYIAVVLDRSAESVAAFLARHAARELGAAEQVRVLQLLEIQRQAMLMYTSCGWFFEDISGIEARQVLQYAGRAMQLAAEVHGRDLEPPFLELLAEARSNLPEQGDGRRVYERYVRPARVDLAHVAAHYAIASLFQPSHERSHVYSYEVERRQYLSRDAGRARLALGALRVTSTVTYERASFSFGALSFGDHNVVCGVREDGDADYQALAREVSVPFERADLAEVIGILTRQFGRLGYSLRSLFRDERRAIMRSVLAPTLAEVEETYRQLYERHAPLMRFLADLQAPLPRGFHLAAEFALSAAVRRALAEEDPDLERAAVLLAEARRTGVAFDRAAVGESFQRTIDRLTERVRARPEALRPIQLLAATVLLAQSLPFEVDLWTPQNVYYALAQGAHGAARERAGRGASDGEAWRLWLEHFAALGEALGMRIGSPHAG
ncbi:MAG TPA: DUF3536 domain-containing protein [Roseiflexaceae bacterium]|nr:DUF3536 domain-containing protein [Roseiflexaceae bacterium]